jgi:hypothetical protein
VFEHDRLRETHNEVEMDFVRVKAIASANNAAVTKMSGYDKRYKLSKPIALGDEFPDDAHYVVDERLMKSIGTNGKVRGDLLPNRENVLLCSPRLADFLTSDGVVGDVECLDVTVFNKTKKASAPYVVVRPLGRIDVVDVEACEVEHNDLNPDQILTPVHKLVFDFTRVPTSVKLLAPEGIKGIYLARREFADKLASDFSGFYIKELDDPTR